MYTVSLINTGFSEFHIIKEHFLLGGVKDKRR